MKKKFIICTILTTNFLISADKQQKYKNTYTHKFDITHNYNQKGLDTKTSKSKETNENKSKKENRFRKAMISTKKVITKVAKSAELYAAEHLRSAIYTLLTAFATYIAYKIGKLIVSKKDAGTQTDRTLEKQKELDSLNDPMY
jgi:hypothetical protein